MMDYKDIQENNFQLNWKQFSISQVCSSVYQMFKFKAIRRKLHFIADFDVGPQKIVSDMERIVKVLHTLLQNAIKYT